MAVKDITPQQAHDVLEADKECVYIDVRTEGEFAAGHPKGAVNIPVALPDPARGMAVNPKFIGVAEKNFSKNKKIIVGCQAGPRSRMAVGLLEQAGYRDVSNVIGGFGGMRDPLGNIVAPGWLGMGLPVSQENGEGVSYQSLAGKTG
jgi:rhodanese-related sulfurtransferase